MLAVFVAIALLRGPVGLAMIAGGIAYLGATGQDMGLAAEQILKQPLRQLRADRRADVSSSRQT